jgi:molybdopterin-guanine dinucleotide biosynthesis protein A
MGADKATLMLAGEPLWSRQMNLLRTLRPETLRVSARTRPAWCPPEMEVVLDEPPSRGPLSGLTAALQCLETSHLFALAIDLPGMTAPMLARIWELARPGCGVIPFNGKSYEPLCAVYPKQAAAIVREALAGDNWSLQRLTEILLRQNLLRARVVAETEKALFHNVNSPADISQVGD